jgi:hypothetical protein
MLSALILLAATAAQPTIGDVNRELATNPNAFAYADRDGDGRISDREYDIYLRFRRGGGAGANYVEVPLGGYDINRDEALTPYELYPEADYRLRAYARPRYRAPACDPRYDDCYADDGQYYVDDRDGEVYDGR